MGEYPDLNREHTVPHTVVLPIELYPPLSFRFYYAEVIRTPNNKYQKPMTCLLVYSIGLIYYITHII